MERLIVLLGLMVVIGIIAYRTNHNNDKK